MSNAVQNQTSSTVSPKAEKSLQERFGAGKYFSIQCEVFRDIQRHFHTPEDVAEKVAKAVATNLGAIFVRGQVQLKGIDKGLNKDGQCKTLSEVVKLKNIAVTHEIALVRTLDYCNKAPSFHVKAVFSLHEDIAKWIASL